MTVPWCGVRPPLITLTIVDLPAPLCPTSPTHSPGMTRKRDAGSSALTAPKLTLAPSTANDRLRYVVHTARHHLLNKTAARSSTAARQPPGDLVCRLDDLDRVFLRVLHIGDATGLGIGEVRFEIVPDLCAGRERRGPS